MSLGLGSRPVAAPLVPVLPPAVVVAAGAAAGVVGPPIDSTARG